MKIRICVLLLALALPACSSGDVQPPSPAPSSSPSSPTPSSPTPTSSPSPTSPALAPYQSALDAFGGEASHALSHVEGGISSGDLEESKIGITELRAAFSKYDDALEGISFPPASAPLRADQKETINKLISYLDELSEVEDVDAFQEAVRGPLFKAELEFTIADEALARSLGAPPQEIQVDEVPTPLAS